MKYAKLIIHGKASQKTFQVPLPSEKELDFSLMDFLRKYGFPIASSCNGEGVCSKCIVRILDSSETFLSCQIRVRAALTHPPYIFDGTVRILIDYL